MITMILKIFSILQSGKSRFRQDEVKVSTQEMFINARK